MTQEEMPKLIVSEFVSLNGVMEAPGDEAAQAVQLGIEYDPAPPFDAGSPEKVPPPIADVVGDRIQGTRSRGSPGGRRDDVSPLQNFS
jgi:hypothetical protein